VIEMGKEYRTRDGREVILYTVSGSDDRRPVVGEYRISVLTWVPTSWRKTGIWWSDNRKSRYDLIEVKPVRVFERWVNIHQDGSSSSYRKREDADAFATEMGRIACLHIRQEYREGDGLCDSEKT
jgi:hypothetical protein